MKPARLANNHPVSAGLITGLGFAVCAAVCCGLLPHVKILWPLLALALAGFGRRVAFQAALLLPVCIVTSVHSALDPMAVLGPAVAALVAANVIARTETKSSFTLDHAVYAASGFVCYVVATAVMVSMKAALVGFLYTTLCLLLVFAVAVGWRLIRGAAPGHREISFASRSLQ